MDSEQRRAIARSVAILVAAVVVIGVIVWAIFFRGTDEKRSTGNTSPPTSQPDKKPTESGSQKTEQKPGETKPTGPSGQPGAVSQNQQPQQLANVGPGSLLPLFAGATVGGSVLHFLGRRYLRLLSSQSHESLE